MVKAIIFDCFGVLTTEGWLPFKTKYFGHNPELFQQATSLVGQANSGLLSHDNFIKKVARLANMSPKEAQVAIRKNVANEPLFAYIKELKKDYKVGFLSNVAGNYLNELFSNQQMALFDAVSLSYQTGVVKPQSRAYEIIAEELKVKLSEAVLIDDQVSNVSGARQAGMQAILYRASVNQLKLDLQPLLSS